MMPGCTRLSNAQPRYDAIKNAKACVPYVPRNGQLTDGAAWRLTGPDHEGEETSVGVETFVDHLGRRLMIVTVF